MKSCTKCGEEKPLGSFSKRASSKDGYSHHCRACRKIAAQAYTAANRETIQAKDRARHAKDLAERGDEMRARRRAWYQRDPSVQRKAVKAWTERNKERVLEYLKHHYEANKAEYFEKSRRRRALKLERQIERFSIEQLDARMSVFGHCCAYCSGPFEEVDHVIPLARGGLHILANLRPACRACNRRKSAKPISAWLREVA